MAVICHLQCEEEEVWDAEDHSHRPAPSKQTAHETQAVHLHRCAASFQGADQLLVPENTDEEGCKDAAGFREASTEAKHSTVGLPQEPSPSKICHGVRQVHQVVGDEVGDGQIDEKDLVCADAGFVPGQGAYSQPVVSQDPCNKHECSDDGFNQLFHCFTRSGNNLSAFRSVWELHNLYIIWGGCC